jgi:hypothetical protein
MRFTYILLLFCFCPLLSVAQFETPNSTEKAPVKKPVKEKKEPFSDRLIVGGGLDFSYGDIVSFGITPILGYELTSSTWVGGIFTYRYFENRVFNPKYSTNTYGAAPFVRQYFFEQLFVHAEYEYLNGQWQFNGENEWVQNLLVGPGYRGYIGDNSHVSFYLLWNVAEDNRYSIYNGAILRMNFTFEL